MADPRDREDAALVARVARQDVPAWEALYDRYVVPVHALAVQLLGRDGADEIVQEAFLRLWTRADQYRPERGSFRVWFFALVRHRILDELRHRSREERFHAAASAEELVAAAIDPIGVDETVSDRQRGRDVLWALHRLPAEQRRVLLLAYFGVGLSQAAIAEELGLPLGTVKKRIRLGLQKLRTLLSPTGPEDAPSRGTEREAAHGL
jgi:RNA polymerase sigma-70 factor (ECF subfamily)